MTNAQLTREQFVLFARAARQAVVATADRNGNPEAALVEIAVLGDGDILFGTLADTRKVKNLFHNNRVAIVIGWDPISLQVEGEAELLMGVDLEAMGAAFAEQFPEKPAPPGPTNLYRVRPEWLRYCETRPGHPPVVAEGLWS